MLLQRVLTAIALLVVFIPTLMVEQSWPMAVFALILMTAGAWEWGKLNTTHQWMPWFCAAIVTALAGASWYGNIFNQSLYSIWMVGGCFWILLSAYLLYAGVSAWGKIPVFFRLFGGIFVLWLAWLAMVVAHRIGINFLLSIMTLVWIADSFAYFTGRRFGLKWFSSKLAPSISPGKSWEGACGGMCGVWLLAVAWILFDTNYHPKSHSIFSIMLDKGWWMLVLSTSLLLTFSVAGDLLESLIKRSAGVKDSGRSLPGHGGVLDRVDALLPTLPLALMLMACVSL